MFTKDQYELLDFGRGRKLERFGDYVLDRPSPPADGAKTSLPDERWREADARYDRDEKGTSGRWTRQREMPEQWIIRHDPFCFELHRSPHGHLGVFVEQADNWDWIARQVAGAGREVKVLNLFAYTGGSTLAAAAAGAEVVHLDAAKNTVARARRNAELSGLADAPIRWIGEDAVKFVKREVKRGNGYDAVILDPPSYGHGASGQVWRLARDLPRLLDLCAQLMADRALFVLLTCHTPGYGPKELSNLLEGAFGRAKIESKPLGLRNSQAQILPSGMAALATFE